MASLKNLTRAEYYAHIEANGHILRREKDGSVDEWGLDCDYHNGPVCIRADCYEFWCVHCRDAVSWCEGAVPELFPLTPSDAISAKD